MPTWPSSLPQDLLVSEFNDTVKDPIIRTSVDAGPDKIRRRFTAVPEYIQGKIILSASQYNTFISFWENDIKHGSLAFTWKHPITGESVDMRFRNPWSVTSKTSMYFVLSLDLEILP